MKSIGIVFGLITLSYFLCMMGYISLSTALWINVLGCVALIPAFVYAQMQHRKMLCAGKEQRS